MTKPAQRYGRMLKRVVRERRVLASDVAHAIGAQSSSMSDWMNGHKMPQVDYAASLAEVLDRPVLLDYALRLRSKTCDICGDDFIDLGKQLKKMYCSKRCAQVASARRARGNLANEQKREKALLALYRERVAAYCADCEPSGLCRTEECPLREVSPLPLVGERAADEVPRRSSDKMLAYLERRYAA